MAERVYCIALIILCTTYEGDLEWEFIYFLSLKKKRESGEHPLKLSGRRSTSLRGDTHIFWQKDSFSCPWGCVRPNVSTPSHVGRRSGWEGPSLCNYGFTCDLQGEGLGALFFHRTVPRFALRQSIPSSPNSGISSCCKYRRGDSGTHFPAWWLCCFPFCVWRAASK